MQLKFQRHLLNISTSYRAQCNTISKCKTAVALIICIQIILLLRVHIFNLYASVDETGETDGLTQVGENDTALRTFMRQLFDAGELLNIAKSVPAADQAPLLTEFYPDRLSLRGYSFRSTDGRELSARRVLSSIWASTSKQQPVPNVVHFYMFYPYERDVQLQFHHYLSMLSAAWLSGADWIILWCSSTPVGHYWNQLMRNLTAHGKQNMLLLATRPLPDRVFNRSVQVVQHQVDVMKLEAAITIGGIILDTDVLTLRSLQPLRNYDCVIGRESPKGLTIGSFMSRPRAAFVTLWYMLYQTFNDRLWDQHSILLPNKIWQRLPRLCRVEENSIARPGFYERIILYGDQTKIPENTKWNWRQNYLVHLWSNGRPKINDISVRRINSMFGQMARFILYGTDQLLEIDAVS